MVQSIHRPLVVAAALLVTAGGVSAQGYGVRTWVYYDPVPYGPVGGETYGHSPYRPTVTVYDSWGRLVEMPLRPKVLYYNAPFQTQQGLYRPQHIVVMPDSRPRYYTSPAPVQVPDQYPSTQPVPRSEPVRPAEPEPIRPVDPEPVRPADPEPARPAKPVVPPPEPIPPAATFPYDGGPTNPVPDVEPDRPAPPKPPAAEVPDPRPVEPVPPPAPRAVPPDRPTAIPTVPELPSVPKVPATDRATTPASPAVPKLGPAPKDIPPTTRPRG